MFFQLSLSLSPSPPPSTSYLSFFLSLVLTPLHLSSSISLPLVAFPSSSFSLADVDICLPLYCSLFPPLTKNIIPSFRPFTLPTRRNGSRRSGRSSNTPACGSRRVWSVRRFHPRRRFLFSFLRAPSGLTLSPFLSFSLPFPRFPFLASLPSVSPCFCLPLAFSRLPIARESVSGASEACRSIERRSIYPPSGYSTHRSDRRAAPRAERHRSLCRSRTFSVSQTPERDGILADQGIAHRLIQEFYRRARDQRYESSNTRRLRDHVKRLGLL